MSAIDRGGRRINPDRRALDPDDATITYSVRDLLAAIKDEQTTGFTRLETALNGKADAADVARLEERVDHHGRRLTTVEEYVHNGQTRQAKRRSTSKAILATASGVCVALGGAAGFLAALHVI